MLTKKQTNTLAFTLALFLAVFTAVPVHAAAIQETFPYSGYASTTSYINGWKLGSEGISGTGTYISDFPTLASPVTVYNLCLNTGHPVSPEVGYLFTGTNSSIATPTSGDSTGFATLMSLATRYQTYTCSGSTPVATDRNNSTTHIIAVTSPVLYSTTTSPVTVGFTYYAASSTVPNGVVMRFTNTLSHAYREILGPLDVGFVSDGTYSYSTSTTLVGDGTWKLSISLVDYNPDVTAIPYAIIDTAPDQWFGLNFNDNVTTVTADACTDSGVASSSCAISFSGTFNLNECSEYLLHPTCSTLEKFKSLTLAHSYPFAYAYQGSAVASNIFNATNTATTTIGVTVPWLGHPQQITFLSAAMIQAVPFTSWLKTMLSALMLVMVAMLVYRQVLKSHDKQTTV